MAKGTKRHVAHASKVSEFDSPISTYVEDVKRRKQTHDDKNGPVTTRQMTPEERIKYGLS